ncbi:hypothetical protein Clacol_007534 [Clathrus columnatus]|uniref:pyridoxal 5'-phosphate synthase n=1 Tax=Clathrus columnatus TaxID=1419009 RepID=A0AAV5AJJ9_9AGAM|nr:hypothetical protein Clacol_007534 [Clathrus columnatus]
MDTLVHSDSSTIKITSHNQYSSDANISPKSVLPSPIAQFEEWITAASLAGIKEPEAMTLSTCTLQGIPSSRIVLLKEIDSRGFVFFTNYTSRKSHELNENPHAALTFHWKEMSRQVRVIGKVEKVSREESEAYFKTRPLGSRIGAWASKQSSVVAEDELAIRVDETRRRFGIEEGATEGDIPLPDFWGGWRVLPEEVEFWAGKPSRLHDRVRYLRTEKASLAAAEWRIERLSP